MKQKDIQLYTDEELDGVCAQLREQIYTTVMRCGGHLSSNLGAVESTVALFRVFNFPKDKIVFDVGHQCYAYKLLSGRADKFSSLRQKDGLSGFPKRKESPYDVYDTGHAGNSISAALGLAKARDLQGENHYVIAYIGDGAFNNGLVYEALNALKILRTKILIILNDNGMSISQTVGGTNDILQSLKGRERADNVRLFEQFGLKYMGVSNGNDVHEMVQALTSAKQELEHSSVLLHVATTKGKGDAFCEEYPTNTHGLSPKRDKSAEEEYSTILGQTLCDLAEQNDKICVVTAAMKEPLGLEEFFVKYPARAFDVGICEENGAVLCSAMAIGGLKPYYAIYSTFLQRAFDEVIHDVCAQNLPVTFCIDRAGITGADGETHQGVFDLSYLSLIPNLTIAVPKDRTEFAEMLKQSASYPYPLAIRYPRCGTTTFTSNQSLQMGKWEYLHTDKQAQVTVLASGEHCLNVAMQALQHYPLNIVNARFCKPIDVEFLKGISTSHVITIEDNVEIGGFGWMVNMTAMQENLPFILKNFACKDVFIPQGNIQELHEVYGVSTQRVIDYLRKVLS